MKVKIYYSELSSVAEEKLIKDLKNRDRAQSHVIITPDKKSLFYEKKLFSLLDEKAFFDVTTTTLSRFANKTNGNTEKILTKQGGVLIIKKILNENINTLKSFGKSCNVVGFASVLYDTICMFKSCNVPYDQIEKCDNPSLADKLKDIKFVYKKYEDYLKTEYTDSFNRLNLCANSINENFKNTNIYFVGFDDFTKQAYGIINKLIKYCASVNIATTLGKKIGKKNNANIYTNAVYYSIIDLAKLNNADIEYKYVEPDLIPEKIHMLNEVFGYSQNKFRSENNYVDVFSYASIEDEVKNTIQSIKYQIIQSGCKYNKFAIVVPSYGSYKALLEKYFNEFEINYFLDEAIKLKDTIVARYFTNYISLAVKPNKYNLLSLLKSPFCDLNYNEISEFENYIFTYNVADYNLLKCDKNQTIGKYLSKYNDFVTKSQECVTINDYTKLIKECIFDNEFFDMAQKLIERYFSENNTYEYRNVKQSLEKLQKIFDEFKVIENYECSLQEFLQFVLLYLDANTITIPPIITDAVFVTELNSGMTAGIDNVYMLGMVEGSAPAYVVDCGLISDKEINDMPKSFRLSPSVSIINKRLKYKTFETLFEANNKLILSYTTKDDSGDCYASAIVENVKNVFGLPAYNASANLNMVQGSGVKFNEDKFVCNNFNKPTAIHNFVSLLKFWDNYNSSLNFVKTIENLNGLVEGRFLENATFENVVPKITINKSYSKMGISEIEKFNMCPYLHFCDYILKLKESDSIEINNMIIGNVLHEFLKDAVFNLNENEDYALKILQKILNKTDYKPFRENKKNNYIIEALKEEVVRIFRVLKIQAETTSFKTSKTEMPFTSKEPIYKDDNNEIYLTGVVDRIDTCENGIRVIDYKTGKIDFKNYNGIYYGNKMQVVVYLGLLCDKKSDIRPLGALYLPISNEFSTTSYEELYKMQGIVENSIQNLLNFDKNILNESYESKVLDIKTNASGQIKRESFYKNMCLNEKQIKDLSKFVLNKVGDTVSQIINGEISPSPVFKSEQCRFCKYLGLCNFSEQYGNSERGDKDYNNVESFLGGNDNAWFWPYGSTARVCGT